VTASTINEAQKPQSSHTTVKGLMDGGPAGKESELGHAAWKTAPVLFQNDEDTAGEKKCFQKNGKYLGGTTYFCGLKKGEIQTRKHSTMKAIVRPVSS